MRVALLMGLVAFLLLRSDGALAGERALPSAGAPGFTAVCDDMYRTLDAGGGWPPMLKGSTKHCTLKTAGADPENMSNDDYAWALRKSLKFACKGRRTVVYEVVRRLQSCGGGTRTLTLAPITDGGCRVAFAETGETFDVAPPLIADLVGWKDDMPWYEAILVRLFAPRELPMLMDGLIGCGAGRKPG